MKSKIILALFSLLTAGLGVHCEVKLNSHPAARATIYLDFDGEIINSPVWNAGNTINCSAAGLNAVQITEVFNRVAEDYRPFEVNITTDIDVFEAAPVDKRIRIIVTPTSAWFPGVGGVSFLGSFTWGDDTPGFVFPDRVGAGNLKRIAECCSHESGHSLGLSHQSRYDEHCNLTATYHDGEGTGETGWAPIMGNSYYRNMSGWSNGPTPYGCSNTQDNLSVITSRNGFSYRLDDYSDDIDAAFEIAQQNINVNGIISTTIDKDAFSFTLPQNVNFNLEAVPFGFSSSNEGADLDIKLSLYDGAKNLVKVYNPEASMSVTIDTILTAGRYYLVAEGSGNSNTSEYGSLGSYTLRGLFGVLPLCSARLNGTITGDIHQLTWSISCNEGVKSSVLQSSTDGIHFVDIYDLRNGQHSFSYTAPQQADIYYRLQVVSLSNNITRSGTVLLKRINQVQGFTVSTFVNSDIRVRSAGSYQYCLTSVNGSSILQGKSTAGSNSIAVNDIAPGIYILKLSGCGTAQTFRILKM